MNIAEATAVSNIPSKVSRKMFFPTIFLQYGKDNMRKTHIEKLQQQKYMVEILFQGKKCRVCNSKKIDY